MMKMSFGKKFCIYFIAGLLLVFSLGLRNACVAQTQEAELSQEVEEAMRLGWAATEQQEWELAIKYFHQARKASPSYPDALINLALACDLAGGRDLAAMAWYNAYLVAAPDAEDAAEVRQRLDELGIKVEAVARKLAQKAEELILAEDRDFWKSEERYKDDPFMLKSLKCVFNEYIENLVFAYLALGNTAAAVKMAYRMKTDSDINDPRSLNVRIYIVIAFESIAEAQARAGDFNGAWSTMARCKRKLDTRQKIKGEYYHGGQTTIEDVGKYIQRLRTRLDKEKKESEAEPVVRATVEEEIQSWANLIEKGSFTFRFTDAQPALRNLSQFFGSLKKSDLRTLSFAAKDIPVCLRSMQNKKAYWQKRRKKEAALPLPSPGLVTQPAPESAPQPAPQPPLVKKWGFIDPTGKMVIEPRFDRVSTFSKKGLAEVCVEK